MFWDDYKKSAKYSRSHVWVKVRSLSKTIPSLDPLHRRQITDLEKGTLRKKMMAKQMSNLMFYGMCFVFMLRDIISPRETILMETGIKPGDYVLDYGCGPGGYVASASKLLGEAGRFYALDINPLAVKKVQRTALKKQLANV